MEHAQNRRLFAFLAIMAALSPLAPVVPAIGAPGAAQEAAATKGKQRTVRRSKRGTVAKDKYDILGPLMNEIGQELANIAGGDPEGIFLYVEIAPGWISPSVFKDEEKVVRYLESDRLELSKRLWDAWYIEPEDRRWSVMEYDIKDGRFAVKFKYPEEVDVESFDVDRREIALHERYDDKPVIYPPIPDKFFELKE